MGVGGVGAVRGHLGVSGVYCGAGRDCRYSGARRGIGGISSIGVPRCVEGCFGTSGVYRSQCVLWASRDCRYSGARRCIGGISVIGVPRGCTGYSGSFWGCQGHWSIWGVRVHWGLAGTVGTQGPKGVWGHQGIGAPRGCRGC